MTPFLYFDIFGLPQPTSQVVLVRPAASTSESTVSIGADLGTSARGGVSVSRAPTVSASNTIHLAVNSEPVLSLVRNGTETIAAIARALPIDESHEAFLRGLTEAATAKRVTRSLRRT